MEDRLFEVGESRRQRQRGPDALVGKSLDRERITRDEVEQSLRVLAVYNEIAESRLDGQAWLRKIILRLREHPELTLDRHREVIARAFEQPWWEGAATPSVVYGNERVFESALATAAQPRQAVRATTRAEMVSANVQRLRQYAEEGDE